MENTVPAIVIDLTHLDIVGAIQSAIAFFALIISLLSFFHSRRAIRLSEQQDQRQQPLITPYLVEDTWIKAESARHYYFKVLFSNVSDADNSIASSYFRFILSRNGVSSLVELSECITSKNSEFMKEKARLQFPLRLDGHQSAVGWIEFNILAVTLSSASIEPQALVFIDAHGKEFEIRPLFLVGQYENERENNTLSE